VGGQIVRSMRVDGEIDGAMRALSAIKRPGVKLWCCRDMLHGAGQQARVGGNPWVDSWSHDSCIQASWCQAVVLRR
jgi:hypothetical protein